MTADIVAQLSSWLDEENGERAASRWEEGDLGRYDAVLATRRTGDRLVGGVWVRPYRQWNKRGKLRQPYFLPKTHREVFMAVNPEVRSEGVGKALFAEAIEVAKRDPDMRVLVAVPQHEQADRMATKLGFEPVSGKPYWILDVSEDDSDEGLREAGPRRRGLGLLLLFVGLALIFLGIAPPYAEWIESWAGFVGGVVGMYGTVGAGGTCVYLGSRMISPDQD